MGVALDWIHCMELWSKLFVILPGVKAAVLPQDNHVVTLVCRSCWVLTIHPFKGTVQYFWRFTSVNNLSNLQQAPQHTGHYPCRGTQQTGADPSFGNSISLKSCYITLRKAEMLLKLLFILLQCCSYLFTPLVGNGHWQPPSLHCQTWQQN